MITNMYDLKSMQIAVYIGALWIYDIVNTLQENSSG